jgi:hypothetical protein
MKIIVRTGCTADAVIIDGKHSTDFTDHELDMLADELFEKLRESYGRGEIDILRLINLFECDSMESDAEACEQCGDRVTTITYNI